MKKMETLTSRVSPQAMRVARKRMMRSVKQMATVLESGLRKVVATPMSTAKLRKQAAMKIMRCVMSMPKKSMMKPTTNSTTPKMKELSVSALQMLLSQNTGQAQGEVAQMMSLSMSEALTLMLDRLAVLAESQLRMNCVEARCSSSLGLVVIVRLSVFYPFPLLYFPQKQLVLESEEQGQHSTYCLTGSLRRTKTQASCCWTQARESLHCGGMKGSQKLKRTPVLLSMVLEQKRPELYWLSSASVNSFPCVLNVQELSVMLASRHPTPHARLATVMNRSKRVAGCYRTERVRGDDADERLMGSTIYLDYNFKIECYSTGKQQLNLPSAGRGYPHLPTLLKQTVVNQWDYIKSIDMSQVTATFRTTIISLMIVSGAINTIAYKFQNKQMVYEGEFFKYFFHPYMQATTMFFGEALAFVIYIFMKRRDPETFNMRMLDAKSQGKEVHYNKFLLAIPAMSDLVTSTLQYVALNFVAGSVYQMMRGGAIVTTFIFSIIFLKMKAQRNQVAGSALALVGVFIVGASSLIFSSSSSSGTDPGLQIIGYILLISSLFTNGFQFVFEEKLLAKYHIEPLEMVGYEGMFGLAIELILIVITSFIPCSFGVEACVLDRAGMPFIESPLAYFSQMGQNGLLLFFVILGVFSIATFNVTGVTVTKYINALARSICDVTRTVIVWIVGIIITLSAGTNRPNYKWELIDGAAITIQLLGFLVLIAGNLIYNKIIKIPFLMPKETANPLLEEDDQESKKPSVLTEGG